MLIGWLEKKNNFLYFSLHFIFFMDFKNRDVISIDDFSKEELLHIVENSTKIHSSMDKYHGLLSGKIMASLFFEPSTRTRLSFDSAMQRLGGSVIGFSDHQTTSMSKGESTSDTVRVIDGYCDVIVMRHPTAGSVKFAADVAKNPIINAGDGANEHPTQTLMDLYTIKKALGRLDGLSIGFVGDLKFGRTVHSLSKALSHFSPTFQFISTPSLSMPKEYLEKFKSKGIEYHEGQDLSKVAKKLDILYVTRIQRERFINSEEYEKVRGIYRLDKSFLKLASPQLKIMHALPRVDELNPHLDNEAQSIYFEQAHNGLPVRMALLALILGKLS